MNPDVLLGIQMNAPPNETPKTLTTSGTERRLAEGAKESKPSFRSLLTERCHHADASSDESLSDQVTEEDASLPALADSSVPPEMGRSEGSAIALQMPVLPVLIDWGVLNVFSQGAASPLLEDKGESWLQSLPMVDLGQDGGGKALNVPQGTSTPQPDSAETANNFATAVVQAGTQDERSAPKALKEFTLVPSKVQFYPQPGIEGAPEGNNRLQQGIEIPESVLISTHGRAVGLGDTATIAQYVMGSAKTRPIVTADQLLHQTVRAVDMMVRLDQSNLHLQLYPESLGRIEIRIAHGAEGTHVLLMADQPQTERLLQTGLNELRQSLTHAGIQLADVAVGGQNAHANLFRQPQGSPVRLQVPLDPISPEASAEGQAYSRIGASDSYVDYRI
ncbi:flagellar hook-length control protein FliK [Thermanaerothrix sp. 4228-RoL]|uniref:Flagellar hook-length control protein FliK n=2 Tax=Thermanaerothrix TaxID=1077886 RepID=A0ABU3NNB8_9CHLR|nr:flagellar hook-length control protein FliK [Thermanaerothrix sp. 4228-RoL]MDT8897678.1 flagellar hook-length control protein FliK [Thermanaerothrix sp. 4228-RoL]